VFIGGEGQGVVMGVSLHVSESSPEEEDMVRVLMILIWLTLWTSQGQDQKGGGSWIALLFVHRCWTKEGVGWRLINKGMPGFDPA
jgi:hypothetical protein